MLGGWRRLQRPWVTLLCAVLIGASWWVVPHDVWWRGVQAPIDWSTRGFTNDDPLYPEFVMVENGMARFIRGTASEGDLWSYAATHGCWVAKVQYRSEIIYDGALGLTRRSVRHVLSFDPKENPIAFEGLLNEYESAGGWKEKAAAEMREFVGERSAVVVWGYFFNAWMIMLGVASAVSLGWVTEVRGWLRERRRMALVSAGKCGRCGYAMAGLGARVCPECGEDNSKAKSSKANMLEGGGGV